MTALFTVGNFVTLGICFCLIFIIRYRDRHNRSVDLAKEYGRRLKDDIAIFAEEKAEGVKDNGLILDVQKSAVKEALNRLTEANADLEEKIQGIVQQRGEVVRIGERISAYDKSMEELIRMNGRVEENLDRLKEESAFVEEAIKKIAGLKAVTEKMENGIGSLELRFARENAAALEKAEAMAVKLEEDALVKYREEALVRVHHFQDTIEEKFHEYHENAKTRIAEIQTLVRSCKDEWKNNHTQMEAEQKEYRESWQRDIEALDALALSQRKQWEDAVTEAEYRLVNLNRDLDSKTGEAEERVLKEVESRLAGYREDQAAQWKHFDALADDAVKLDSQLRLAMETAEARVRKDFALFEEEQKRERERVSAALVEKEDILKAQMISVEQELNVLKKRAYDNVSEKLKLLEDDFFTDLAKRGTDIDSRLNEWHLDLERKLTSLGEKAETEQHNLEVSFREEFNARIGDQSERILSELEKLRIKAETFEEKIQSGLDKTESRVSALSGSAEEIHRELKEFNAQTRLFEKTDELKADLERSMETLKADRSKVEEYRTEVAKLETEFIKIRRLEDEANTKMTRFLSEKNHLEAIEKDFDKLIQTSLRVEERLREVTGADDTLQHIQVSLRKMEDAVAAAEDKYQRVENKNRILEETNRGIERNFQILEETEMALRKFRENIDRAEDELDSFRPAIEKLAAASEKARLTEEKLNTLDTNLAEIDDKIEKMQTAREWLAKAETRFEELYRKAQEELKLLGAVLKDETKKTGPAKGAPTLADRETVIRLRRQGWDIEAIARTLKKSEGEVSLILEMGAKDK